MSTQRSPAHPRSLSVRQLGNITAQQEERGGQCLMVCLVAAVVHVLPPILWGHITLYCGGHTASHDMRYGGSNTSYFAPQPRYIARGTFLLGGARPLRRLLIGSRSRQFVCVATARAMPKPGLITWPAQGHCSPQYAYVTVGTPGKPIISNPRFMLPAFLAISGLSIPIPFESSWQAAPATERGLLGLRMAPLALRLRRLHTTRCSSLTLRWPSTTTSPTPHAPPPAHMCMLQSVGSLVRDRCPQ